MQLKKVHEEDENMFSKCMCSLDSKFHLLQMLKGF